MGKWIDNISTLLMIGGGIALIVCGTKIAKPNLHGIKFESGNCTIRRATSSTGWSNLPKCDCGKNCEEEYPCLNVFASFHSNVSTTSWISGTLHEDYWALEKGCIYTPDDCDKEFVKNAYAVYSYFTNNIVPKLNYNSTYPYYLNSSDVSYTNASTFSCWGYDGTMYLEHSYTPLKVYLSLGLPSVFLIIGLLMTFTVASSDHRSEVLGWLAFPFLVVGAIIVFLLSIIGCKDCHQRRPECCRESSAERRGREYLEQQRESSAERRRRLEQQRSASVESGISMRSWFGTAGHSPTAGSPRDQMTFRRSSVEVVPAADLTVQVGPPAYPGAYPGTETMDLPPPPSYNEAIAAPECDIPYPGHTST